MMKKTHIVTGVTLSSVAATAISIHVNPAFVIISAIGSIFPDTDHPSGALNQKLLLVHNWIFKLITYVGLAAALFYYGGKHIDHKVIYYMIPILIAIGVSRHRSVTHSMLGCGFVTVFLIYIKIKYRVDMVAPFTLGFISHIVMDMFNPEGVELLWPYKKHIRFPFTVETNGLGEKCIFYTFILGIVWVALKAYKLI